MSICNDGSTLCDACADQFWPGSSYESGEPDTVFEVWPGFHACLGCVRSRFEREHRLSVRQDALATLRHRSHTLEAMREEPGTLKVSTLTLLAWEAAEPVRDGALDYASAMAKLLSAAAYAGIDPVTARQVVASVFTEVSSWTTAA
jgi:hypothetical protein